ncbi:hypothetical protein ACWKSP_17585 [Micromonosporaceae bacterium Da 78-11]
MAERYESWPAPHGYPPPPAGPPHPGPPQQGQPHPAQVQPGPPYPGPPYPGPPYPGQPYPGQPYPTRFIPPDAQPGQFQPAFRPPSGLFPGHPSRPVYREPHPVRAAQLMSGLGSGLIWLALFGSLAKDLAAYAWWTIAAAVTAWIVATVLSILGDRGVAVGVTLAAGFGLSIAMSFVAGRWITTYDWPLW